MRPFSRLEHLLSSTVTVAARSTMNTYGKPTYGAATAYKAHIARKRTLVRTGSGQQVESGQVVYLSTTDAILPTAQLTLSTGDVGSTEEAAIHPTIMAVERLNDQNGPHHVVLYL